MPISSNNIPSQIAKPPSLKTDKNLKVPVKKKGKARSKKSKK